MSPDPIPPNQPQSPNPDPDPTPNPDLPTPEPPSYPEPAPEPGPDPSRPPHPGHIYERVHNPNFPTPGSKTPGIEIDPAFPPTSPGAPLIDPTPIAPVTMSDGTAYPEPPPSYEHAHLAPPEPTQGVDIQHSTYAEPTYQPDSISSLRHAQPHPTEQSHPADAAYPSAPPVYERRASDRDPGAPSPSPSPFGRRHTDQRPPAPDSLGGSPRTPSRAPVALIGTVIVAVLALGAWAAWYFLHAGGHVITAGGELAATAAGLHYENPKEHIAFTAPGTWTRFPASTAQVMVRGEGCSFGLLEQRTLLSAHQLADSEAQDLHHRHPEATPTITLRTIAGHDALTFSGTYTDSEGQPMTQTYILVDRGANLLTLIETGTSALCPPSFSALEESLHL